MKNSIKSTILFMEKLEYQILDKGFLRVVDYMGGDDSIVQAARVSYGQGTKTMRDDRNLIRYLLKHRHTTPFEMCEIKIHVKAPIFVVRQWVRHRTSSLNEYSARYSEMPSEFYYPSIEMLQRQSQSNKQGGHGNFTQDEYNEIIKDMMEVCDTSYQTYQKLLEKQVARETARGILPVNIYTQFYWKIDVHNLMHFLKLRSAENAQNEIREYALKLMEIFAKWMPITYEAFVDYSLKGKMYSRIENEIIMKCIEKDTLQKVLKENNELSNRETEALLKNSL